MVPLFYQFPIFFSFAISPPQPFADMGELEMQQTGYFSSLFLLSILFSS